MRRHARTDGNFEQRHFVSGKSPMNISSKILSVDDRFIERQEKQLEGPWL
jgi:hypothetical protein